MAIRHRAQLATTKLELLTGWLPGRSWCPRDPTVIVAGSVTLALVRVLGPAGAAGDELTVEERMVPDPSADDGLTD